MKKWRIQSGSLDCVEEGETYKDAFKTAIEKHEPKNLGLIVSILEDGKSEDQEYFVLTERALQAIGKWSE